jgi:hypothetical protein
VSVRGRARIAIAASGAIIALLVAAGASGANLVPLVPIGGVNGQQLEVRPAHIYYELGSSLAGAPSVHHPLGRLRWASWTSRQAFGSGYDWIATHPGLLANPYAARVRLYRARQEHGRLVFTRMTIIYTHTPPPGRPRTRTLDVVYMSGGFNWNPTF